MRALLLLLVRGLVACGGGAVLSCAAAPPVAHGTAPLARAPAADASGPSPGERATALFDMHSSFWTNTHLRLHYAATGRRPAPATAPGAPTATVWRESVDYYRRRFGDRGGFGLFLNDELVAIGRALSANGSDPHLSNVDSELAARLMSTAEILRPEWPAEHARNRAWISALQPRLAKHGPAMVQELVELYQSPWPKEPVPVEVSCFAGPVGAYTVDAPNLITISSCDPGYAEDAALEMIFHEASHLLIAPIEKGLAAAAGRRGRPVPERLWHSIIFYTTGEVARRRLGSSYVPYAMKNGLLAADNHEAALRERWHPYLDRRINLDEALDSLLAALTP
jgi:hypothetical protein